MIGMTGYFLLFVGGIYLLSRQDWPRLGYDPSEFEIFWGLVAALLLVGYLYKHHVLGWESGLVLLLIAIGYYITFRWIRHCYVRMKKRRERRICLRYVRIPKRVV